MDSNVPQSHNSVSLPRPVSDTGLNDVEPNLSAVPQPQQPDSIADSSPASQGTVPQTTPMAPDSDTMSPEWVARVNGLMRQTVADPRTLSKEFAALKAQYISGRYGKEIKQTDEKG